MPSLEGLGYETFFVSGGAWGLRDASMSGRMYASREYGHRLLCATVPEFLSGDWRLLSCDAVSVRKQRGKHIAVYSFSYVTTNGDHTPRHDRVLAKIYGADRDSMGHDAQASLWAAGFRPPSAFRVPKSYCYSTELRALVQEEVSAEPWANCLSETLEAGRQAAALAAAWLLRLQRSTVEASDPGRIAEINAVAGFADNVAQSHPQCAATVRSIAKELDCRLYTDRAPLVPSHGDFHPKNVLLNDQCITVIDFDHFGLRSAAFDVGYAIGQLHIMSYLRLGDMVPGIYAATTFWDRYRRAGDARWPDVATHVARTFMQSLDYELCTLRNGRTDLLSPWLALAETFLKSAEFPDLQRVRPLASASGGSQ